jgi:diguanylate cyclase (GGDEF)-like protein
MDKFMYWLAPKDTYGFIGRCIGLIGIVAFANAIFGTIMDDGHSHQPAYYLAHALFVGGPLICFFLAVTVFQIRLQRRLWRLSRKDGLTGLNNRRTFFELTDKRRAQGTTGILLMLDADWFKKINDTYGHNAGDKCLKSIAYTLRRNTRSDDVVGRIGGEEFAIYLQDATLEDAQAIGERLTAPIPFQSDTKQELTVTLSIGAAVSYPQDTLDQMFAAADGALYCAKLKGRARMIFSEKTPPQSNAMQA